MKDTANKPALQGIEAMQIFARASWDAFQACKDSLSEARREEIHRLTYELWEEVGAAVKEARLAVHEAAFQQFKVKLTKRPHGNSKLAKDLKQEVGHEH
ncbi:MAG: hypothetical protein ACN6OP_12830 [Pseudomonadales bacterium]